MSEGIQLEQETLNKIETVKQSFARITAELGNLELHRIFVETEKERLTEEYKSILQLEQETMEELKEKYGQGVIDLENKKYIKS